MVIGFIAFSSSVVLRNCRSKKKMTVKSIKETQDQVINDLEIQKKSKDFSPLLLLRKQEELRESGGGSSTKESPEWVARKYSERNKTGLMHSRVLRIREEDSHLGEDVVEGLSSVVVAKDKMKTTTQQQQLRRVASAVDVVLLSRPILPSSPLSGKALP